MCSFVTHKTTADITGKPLNYGRLTSMSIMLPSQIFAQLSLADVLPSCLASLGAPDFENKLGLAPARSAVVVLVDGLGTHNLRNAQAHARFLAGKLTSSPELSTVFPSTTAAALASLATGATPGAHGMTGYKTRDPESGHVVNLLTGLGALSHPESWLTSPALYHTAQECNISTSVVAHPRFADTPLTHLIHSGATQISAKTLDDRVEATLSAVSEQGAQLVVLYFSELDELAHNKGVNSPEWAAALESLDGALKMLSERLPADGGVIVTADHGVIDVPASRHYLYGNDVDHMQHIESVGGEPRCLQLYFSQESTQQERQKTLTAWRSDWSELAYVLTREEVVSSGLYGDVAKSNLEKLGDIFVLAKKDVAFYDERDLTLKGRAMIGQHGGISPAEMAIPGILLGAFA